MSQKHIYGASAVSWVLQMGFQKKKNLFLFCYFLNPGNEIINIVDVFKGIMLDLK